MIRNYFLINLLLLIMISLLGVKFHSILTTRLEIPDSPSQVESAALKINMPYMERKAIEESSYEVISDKNLFHPSRSAASVKKEEPAVTVNTGEFQLFGTTIMAHKKFALLQEPGSKKTKLYYVNDRIAGFTVSDIFEDKVILQKGDESVELRLRADKKFAPPAPIQNTAPSISKQVKRPQPPRRRPQRRRPARRYPRQQ